MKLCLVLFSVHVLAVSLNRAIGLSPRCWPSPRVGVQGTFPQDLPGFLQPPSPFCCYPFAIPSSFPLPGCPISRFFLPGGPPIPSDPQDWVCPREINPGVVGEPVWHRLGEQKPGLESNLWQELIVPAGGSKARRIKGKQRALCAAGISSLGSENPRNPRTQGCPHSVPVTNLHPGTRPGELNPPSTHHGVSLLKTTLMRFGREGRTHLCFDEGLRDNHSFFCWTMTKGKSKPPCYQWHPTAL